MNDNNYRKGNGQYDSQYNGMNDNFYDYPNGNYGNNNYYNDEDNYTVPIDNNLPNQNSYNQKNEWSDFDQGRYGGKNDAYKNTDYYTDYMNNEYNYYEDDYMYNEQYAIDYGNGLDNYNNGYNYGEYEGTAYQSNFEPSLYEISDNLNKKMNEEMLYTSLMNQSKDSKNRYEMDSYGKDGYNKTSYEKNSYNNSYRDGNSSFDNVTVGINIAQQGSSYDSRPHRESLYNSGRYDDDRYDSINSRSDYYDRNRAYDNKLIPTQDIVFDDAYVVRNQLFEDEDKLFTFNDLLSFLICIVFAVILAFLITRYVAQLTEVDGPSMSHNLQNKDDLLLDKFSFKVRKPKRYEIVVFPVDNDNYYIKRIIGLPKEKVDVQGAKYDTEGNLISKSKVFINGKELTDEIYGFQDISGTAGDNAHVKLGEDEYYVMGDNRNNSMDSRRSEIGAIKGQDFVGRAIFRVFPLESFGPIDSHINEKIYKGDETLRQKYKVD